METKKVVKKKVAQKTMQEEKPKTWIRWAIGAIVVLVIAGIVYYLI